MTVALEPMLTPEQISIRCAVHYKTVMNWIKTGQLPARQVGRQFRVEEEDLEAFMKVYKPRGERKEE